MEYDEKLFMREYDLVRTNMVTKGKHRYAVYRSRLPKWSDRLWYRHRNEFWAIDPRACEVMDNFRK